MDTAKTEIIAQDNKAETAEHGSLSMEEGIEIALRIRKDHAEIFRLLEDS